VTVGGQRVPPQQAWGLLEYKTATLAKSPSLGPLLASPRNQPRASPDSVPRLPPLPSGLGPLGDWGIPPGTWVQRRPPAKRLN